MFAMSLKLKVPQVCNKALINLFQILWFGMLNLITNRVVLYCTRFMALASISISNFGMIMAIALPIVVAFLVGSAIFRLRVSGVYVAIITLALVLLVSFNLSTHNQLQTVLTG